MRINTILTSCLLLTSLSGCSTTVSMTSSPSDAQVTINDRIVRYTPFTVSYSNMNERALLFAIRKAGYETVKGVVSAKGGDFHIDLGTSQMTTSEPFISIEDFNKQRELEEARTKTPDPFTDDGDNF